MVIKKRKNRELLDDQFEEYTGNSTIHGIRYLGERKRPVAEKIWWIIVFIISITFCTIYIRQIYMKWKYELVIVSFAEKPAPVRDIPFPSITICSEVKSVRSKFNYEATVKNVDLVSENLTNTLNITNEE